MQEWIINLESALPVSLVGRKAATLSKLIEAGFPVPQSVCITTAALDNASANGSEQLSIRKEILEAIRQLLPVNAPLAVRSSAVQEDMPEVSFAGRYTTHLNVTGAAALERAILDCWRSYFTVSPMGDGRGMAVLIQPMLDAECAGVCFTVDPVRHQPNNILVVSGWGLGIGVVSGSIPTDTALLRRFDLRVEKLSIANKHTALRASVQDEVTPVPLSPELHNIPCLPDDWLHRIGEYGLTIEQLLGTPQDIEWAIADGQVWILQSRPITALPDGVKEAVQYPIHWETDEEPCHYWWLQQAGDNTGSPVLPAMLDFSRLSIRGGQDAVYFGGGSQTRWRKEVNGRAYWTVANAPHSPGHGRVYQAALQELYERLRQQDITPWEYWGPEVVSATRRLAAFSAVDADAPALADHLEDAVATSTRHWMQHTMGTRPIRDAGLQEAYARLTGLPTEDVASEIPFLLSGTETIQTRLVESLYDLACLAQEFPEEAKAVVLGRAERLSVSSKHKTFDTALQHLIIEYGDRLCRREILGYPVRIPLPWREVPEYIWEMIASYLPLARQGRPSLREVRVQTKDTLDQRIESLCTAAIQAGVGRETVEDFRRKLSYARRNAFSLDEHNHYIDQLSEGQFVQALLHAGRWLAAHGHLSTPFDVFWLHTEEVLAALRGSSNGLEKILAARRAEFTRWQALLAPACLGLPIPQLPARPAKPEHTIDPNMHPINLSNHQLTGEPASRGHATGRARLVDGDGVPVDIHPGDIMVAPFASPVLIPMLPAIAGVVLDYGGPGDHFAITAREFGLPAVCGTVHATRLIPEGAQVTLDADSGHVTWA